MSKGKIGVIVSPADREKAQPILDALRQKGFEGVEYAAAGNVRAVLLFLSAAFAADEAAQERFFAADSAGREIIPIDLDGAGQSELVSSALIAKNAIAASGRTAEEIAERVASAEALQKKKFPLTKLLIAAAAALLLLGLGIYFARGAGEKPSAEAGRTDEALALAQERYGLTKEDLAAVMDVVIVSDRIGFFTLEDFENGGWPRASDFATLDEWNGVHWYSTEDGQELGMCRYDDLRVLELMPSLHHLYMVLVEADADALPDLSGAGYLEDVYLLSCNIDTLDWLAGAPVKSASVRFTPIRDFGPLTACERLKDLFVDMYGTAVTTDLSSFAPPQLRELRLWHANAEGTIDLSGLEGCGELRSVYLGDLPIEDLSFLSSAAELRELTLDQIGGVESLDGLEGLPLLDSLELFWCEGLRDISALRGLTGSLRTLRFRGCPRIADFTPISGCAGLHTVEIQEMDNLRDASFLAPMTWLKSIVIGSCELQDLNFLEGFADTVGIELELWGNVRDYSGLAYVKRYQKLKIDPRTRYNERGSMERLYAYIEGAKVKELRLESCTDLDLGRLPEVTERLELRDCDLTSLEGLPAWQLGALRLEYMPYLASLDGLENLVALGQPLALELEICGCLRLTDWSAIEKSSLRFLQLEDLYDLPDLDGIAFRYLSLRNLPELTDLQLLKGVDNSRGCDAVRIEEMPALRDISALGRLKISYLRIPPQVEEQAQDLLESGSVKEYEIAYPEGSWEKDEGEFVLLSLDELDTLPKALLRRVRSLCVAGDVVADTERYNLQDDWDRRLEREVPGILLHDRESGEEIPVSIGTIGDMGRISLLTGLNRLCLDAQPLENLEGIQSLEELRELRLDSCPRLTDVSAAFALQGLEQLSLRHTKVASIQGVQNLEHLRMLDLDSSAVTDLSPLRDCDFSFAYEQGGLQLGLYGLKLEDLSPLASVRCFERLDLSGHDAALWLDVLERSEIRSLNAHGSDLGQEQFERLVSAHPELEELQIPYNDKITDLTPLLGMEHLQRVLINRDMKKAVASLEGQNLPFELEIR